jgi:hypothetical protein
MSGMALATATALALSPALVATQAATPTAAPLSVHTDDVQLAGIGQDIYYALTPWVQEAVGGVSYIVNVTPIIGAPIAAQININYFQGIQPVIEATVDYLAGVVANPLNFFPITAAYGSALYDIGYNWVSAELVWIGLQPLPPLPPRASAGGRARAAAVQTPPKPVELPAPAPVVPTVICCTPQIESPVAAEGPRPTLRRAPRGAATRASERAVPRAAGSEARGAAEPTRSSVTKASPRR